MRGLRSTPWIHSRWQPSKSHNGHILENACTSQADAPRRLQSSVINSLMTPQKLILVNFQCPGDLLMLTAALRDLHRAMPGRYLTDVRSPCPDLWLNNPYLTEISGKDPEAIVIKCEYPLIHQSNQRPYHFIHGFHQFLSSQLNCSFSPTEFRGDIHLAEDELELPEFARSRIGDRPFWIVVAGGKSDFTIKWWEAKRWQEVIDQFRGTLTFVQTGLVEHGHPGLRGVIDLRGKTTTREFIRLMHHASGVICPVTFAMHLAAAVPVPSGRPPLRPCVVVAGGREAAHWEAYPGHRFLDTIGMLPCCASGGCWKSRTVPLGDGDEKDEPDRLCADVVGTLPRCMDMIGPSHVISAIEGFLQFAASSSCNQHEQAM